MSEILKSKGIIGFFVFVVIMGVLTTNSINNMKENDNLNNVVLLNDTAK